MTIGAALHELLRPADCDCACYRRGYLVARMDTLRTIFPRMSESKLQRLAAPLRSDR